jgi:alanine racemase
MARAWADVSLGAIAANAASLRERCPGAELCAVVKADGYGHGAVPVARAAVEGGASWLAVAQVPEASALRAGGLTTPILLLAEPRPAELPEALAAAVHVTAYTVDLLRRLSSAARGYDRPVPVHLKVDTGMHRVGAGPEELVDLARMVHDDPHLELAAVWTHCAVADDPDDPFTATQLAAFDESVAAVEAAGIPVPLRHAANSATAIAHPAGRYDLVRCGIALYGIPPAPALAGCLALEPALRLATEVAHVHPVAAGEGVSYGRHHRTARDTIVATLPVGYADGVPRRLGLLRQDVIVAGQRRPMIGAVTMDQLMVDVGTDVAVRPGDEVVLLGAQGDQRIAPDEWADRLGTIAYEVVCGIGPRVERRYVAS